MNKRISQRIAAIGLYLFGTFELMGMLMLFIPEAYMPSGFNSQSEFWALISGIYGVSRILAGYAIWSNKKWGVVFGLMLCLTTMIVAPTIVPFGIVDLIFTVIITVALLDTFYGKAKMIVD
jgi:hypothetical protein